MRCFDQLDLIAGLLVGSVASPTLLLIAAAYFKERR